MLVPASLRDGRTDGIMAPMASDSRPVLIAYDGSPESRVAVTTAVAFFQGHTLVVLTAWEPGLADLLAGASGVALRSSSGALTAETARVGRDEVAELARTGTELAESHGATAETLAVNDSAGVASAIALEAERLDVCAVVIGSRGLGRVRAPLLGSTSQALLRSTTRPVVVVRAPH